MPLKIKQHDFRLLSVTGGYFIFIVEKNKSSNQEESTRLLRKKGKNKTIWRLKGNGLPKPENRVRRKLYAAG